MGLPVSFVVPREVARRECHRSIRSRGMARADGQHGRVDVVVVATDVRTRRVHRWRDADRGREGRARDVPFHGAQECPAPLAGRRRDVGRGGRGLGHVHLPALREMHSNCGRSRMCLQQQAGFLRPRTMQDSVL